MRRNEERRIKKKDRHGSRGQRDQRSISYGSTTSCSVENIRGSLTPGRKQFCMIRRDDILTFTVIEAGSESLYKYLPYMLQSVSFHNIGIDHAIGTVWMLIIS